MESYRVYKSLPVDDFMEMTAFVMAKVGLSLTPLIQNTNYFRRSESHTDNYIKERFISDVRKTITTNYENLEEDMSILDMDKYYAFIPAPKTIPCTFRMYADVKMNRSVDSEADYISPGGYAMRMGDRLIRFDFKESCTSVDKKDDSIIHIEHRDPDFDVFDDLRYVTPDLLRRVSDISEFFIYTGEKGETDLKPVQLLNCTFCLPYNDYKNIGVASTVCKEAIVTSNIN